MDKEIVILFLKAAVISTVCVCVGNGLIWTGKTICTLPKRKRKKFSQNEKERVSESYNCQQGEQWGWNDLLNTEQDSINFISPSKRRKRGGEGGSKG